MNQETNIYIAKGSGNGLITAIEDEDNHDSLRLFQSDDDDRITTGQALNEACKETAKHLRLLAYRFELLALEKDPFKVATQGRINKIVDIPDTKG